jgi:hypothetical protein
MGQTYTSGDYQYTLSNGQAYITYYTGAGGAVVIPSTLNSYPVVSIGQMAFNLCYSLTSITIPASVTSIGENAFADCPNLTSVTIPNSVTSIGSGAFSGSGLVSVSIPNSVTSIGSGAFADCYNLTSVTIPSRVTSIGSYAFSGCGSLGFVSIPSSVTSIGSYAFSGSGLGSVLLPPNLSPSQISQAGFPSTAVFYVGSVGLPTSMASQADLATTQAELAKIKTDLANTKTDLSSYFAKFPKFIKIHLPRSPWSKEKK